ncbi:MAG: transposase [Candidatus Cloacimonetes bacterium]|nr:transposase [Candidatus Cloacimonadota bacterium]
MSTKKNYVKSYSPKLKFQAVMEILKGNDVACVSRAYGVHPTSINNWKRKVMEQGPELFSSDSTVREYEKQVETLEKLLGKKEVEIAFLKNFLGQIN